MKNTKSAIFISIFSILIVLISVVGITVGASYNRAVALREESLEAENAITVAQQNRYEKMDALIDALTNLQTHVETQLQKITDARAAYITAAQSGNVDDMATEEETLETEFVALQVIIEDNPDTFIATDAYTDYMAEISATTNYVTTARNSYNSYVGEYNTYIQAFPRNIFLSWFGHGAVLSYYTAPSVTAGMPLIG